MEPIKDVVKKYQAELKKSGILPDIGGERFMEEDGIPSRTFILSLTSKKDMFHNFLRDCGLIRKTFTCEKCKKEMYLKAGKKVKDGMIWNCSKRVRKKQCNFSKSIRYGSWFSGSKLTMEEAMILTYELVNRVPTKRIIKDYGFSTSTLADWSKYVKDVLMNYIEAHSERVGGLNKVVEIEESTFGKQKYNRKHFSEGQSVFGGVERGSGKAFLVPVGNRNAETLTRLIMEWIEPGTTIVTNCRTAFDMLEDERFINLTVNHGIKFVDTQTGAGTSTIESIRQCVQKQIPAYRRQGQFKNYMADYMFRKLVAVDGDDVMNKFLEIVRDIHWSEELAKGAKL